MVIDGDTATVRLREAEARAHRRYGKALDSIDPSVPHYHVRERLRKWRDEWLRAMQGEWNLLLMGRHPRQFEFYRDGKPRQS